MVTQHRDSFWKTTVLAAFSGVTAITAGYLASQFVIPTGAHTLHTIVVCITWLLGLAAALIVIGGLVVLRRDSDQATGRPDLFLTLNRHRSEKALASRSAGDSGRSRWGRFLGPSVPRVGEMVEIRSLPEIMKTLDSAGCVEGLPFMEEMAKFCGQRARVYRVVDKIYDYGRTKTLKRFTNSVLLIGLRCNGAMHGGCQAGCYIIWKTAWLKPVHSSSGIVNVNEAREMATSGLMPIPETKADQYTCQYTELAKAASPLSERDFRQDLRPLLSGNLTVAAFCIAMLTRVFNRVQQLRGGVAFPAIEPSTRSRTPVEHLGVMPGDAVRVSTGNEIAKTLNAKNKNRGLWFDKDMLKYAGQRHTVQARVDRIIDDATGRMIDIKTPCIVLDGVDGSGEFLRFCAQHDFLYWREAWLVAENQAARTTDVAANDQELVKASKP